MIKNNKGWLMSRKKQVCSFPGATTEEMNFFFKPLISRKPEKIILHTGTNDLSQGSVEQVPCNIIKLAEEIEENGIRCTVSSIITRRGKLNKKVKQVNKRLGNIVDDNSSLRFICNENISFNHLNNGGLYLNKRGDEALALNFISFIRKDKHRDITLPVNLITEPAKSITSHCEDKSDDEQTHLASVSKAKGFKIVSLIND